MAVQSGTAHPACQLARRAQARPESDDGVSAPARASLTVVLLATALLVGCGGDDDSDGAPEPAVTGPLDEKSSDLFVLRGSSSASGGRIEITTDVVEWFTDRPKRKAGVANADELIENWEDYGFTTDPPNAALAGEQTDAEVELTKPKATSDGLSFAYKPLRGTVSSEDESMSVFIDSSEWKTDMHVYVKAGGTSSYGPGWCSSGPSTDYKTVLTNPQISSAPANWSYYPTDSLTLTTADQEIFTAASKSGTTSFTVTYDVKCSDGGRVGQVEFTGKVPDNLNPDSFSCSSQNIVAANPSQNFKCSGSEGGGYHVDAYATLSYDQNG
jgi:hypothetical protein